MKLYRRMFVADTVFNFFAFVILLVYLRMVMEIGAAGFKLVILSAILLGILVLLSSFIYNWTQLNAAVKLVETPEDKRFKSPSEWLDLDKRLAAYPGKTTFSTFLCWSLGGVLAGTLLHFWKNYLSLREMSYIIIGGVLMGGMCSGYNFFFFKLHLAPLRLRLAPSVTPPDWKPTGSIRNMLFAAFLSVCTALVFFPAALFYVRVHELHWDAVREEGRSLLGLINAELSDKTILSNGKLTPEALSVLEDIIPGKHGSVMLYDDRGRVYHGSIAEVSDVIWKKIQTGNSEWLSDPDKGLDIVFGPVGGGPLKAAVVYRQRDFAGEDYRLIKFMMVVVGLALIMATGLIILLTRYLGGMVGQLVAGVGTVSIADLNKKIAFSSDGEFGVLERSLGMMKNKLVLLIETQRSLVDRIGSSVERVVKATAELREVSREQAATSAEQASAAQEAGITSEEVKSTSDTIAQRAASVSEMASETLNVTAKGAVAAAQAVTVIRQVEQRVSLITEKMLRLEDNIQNIGAITDTIKNISQNTRLLAVNAAIEARGAGEAAERFAMVAAEIQSQSQSTAKSAGEVREQIEKIRAAMKEGIISTEEGKESAIGGVSKVESVADTFSLMENIAAKTTENAKEIAISIKQQTTASEQMAKTMAELHESAIQVANGAKRIETATATLDSLAEELKRMVLDSPAGARVQLQG